LRFETKLTDFRRLDYDLAQCSPMSLDARNQSTKGDSLGTSNLQDTPEIGKRQSFGSAYGGSNLRGQPISPDPMVPNLSFIFVAVALNCIVRFGAER